MKMQIYTIHQIVPRNQSTRINRNQLQKVVKLILRNHYRRDLLRMGMRFQSEMKSLESGLKMMKTRTFPPLIPFNLPVWMGIRRLKETMVKMA